MYGAVSSGTALSAQRRAADRTPHLWPRGSPLLCSPPVPSRVPLLVGDGATGIRTELREDVARRIPCNEAEEKWRGSPPIRTALVGGRLANHLLPSRPRRYAPKLRQRPARPPWSAFPLDSLANRRHQIGDVTMTVLIQDDHQLAGVAVCPEREFKSAPAIPSRPITPARRQHAGRIGTRRNSQ